MKKIYLSLIVFLIVSINVYAQIALEIKTSGYGDIYGEHSIQGNSSANVIGVSVAPDISAGDLTSSANINAISIGTGRSYGLYLDNSELGNVIYGATIKSISNSASAYGAYVSVFSAGGTLGNIAGDIYAEYKGTSSSSTAYGIRVATKGTLGNIEKTANITAVSHNSVAHGIYTSVVNNIGEISGTFNISAKGYVNGAAFGVTPGGSFALYNSTKGNSTGFNIDWSNVSFNVESFDSRAYGVNFQDVYDPKLKDGIGGDTSATAKGSDIARALRFRLSEDSIASDFEIGEISGNATSNSSSADSIALRLLNDSVSLNISVSKISGNITANAVSGDAYAIDNSRSDIGEISGNIKAYSESGNAYAINTTNGGSFGIITGKIYASSDNKNSYGIYSDMQNHTIEFSNESQVKATQNENDDKYEYGTALNNVNGLKIVSLDDKTTSIIGNINTGENNFVIQSGFFEIASDTWNAKRVSFGDNNDGIITNTNIKLIDSVFIDANEVNFYANSLNDFSTIQIDVGNTLTMQSVELLNFYLSEGFSYSKGDEILFVRGLVSILDTVEAKAYIGEDELIKGQDWDIIKTSEGFGIVFVIPEPSTYGLIFSIFGLLVVMIYRRKFKK